MTPQQHYIRTQTYHKVSKDFTINENLIKRGDRMRSHEYARDYGDVGTEGYYRAYFIKLKEQQ